MYDAGVPPSLVGKNRLPDLIAFVKQAQPHIWGIQEATGWERGTPSTIHQVAQELGMNYFLAPVPSGFHLGLITQFEILETENLSSEIGRQGVLRATLSTFDGKRVNVFIAHLDPASADTRLCEINALIQQMQPYVGQWTILLGDMNFQPFSREYQRLAQAGWKPIAIEPSWSIDQIWVPASMRWNNTDWFQSLSSPINLSDHLPIGAELNIFPITTTQPTVTPFPQTPTVPASQFASNALTGARVLRFDGFDDPCAFSRWTARWQTEKISNGTLEIIGEEPWQALVTRYKTFFAGQGVLIRFQYVPGSQFELHFDKPAWNIEPYRRFGISIFNDHARAVTWQDTNLRSEYLSDDPEFAPNVWYTLLLALVKEGELGAQIWDSTDPRRIIKYYGRLDNKSPELPWLFRINVNRGKVLVDSLTELALSEIK